jgi:hypothetical protein
MRRVKKEGLTEKILTFLAEKLKDLFELGITIVFDPQSLFKGFSLYQFPGLSPSEAQKLVQKRISNLKTKRIS